jgi:hypothetical protein
MNRLGRLLLWAHEALVEADPSNADRFAAVLEVLHNRAKAVGSESQDAPCEPVAPTPRPAANES